ncbi:helix-turn-helix domain-containing protein [Cyanobacteria bacterium FACHB-502]|nr:helix-turn-helix domain-containing protein [Cyanobacteria bacterium FACHB-502]
MGDFDRKQLEQLNAIGEYLQHIRQDQGRSLDDISAKTYIPLRILRALEGGQSTILPEAVFVQGFIRRYGDALGLDGMTLSRSFPVEHEAIGFESPEREQAESTQSLVETRVPDSSRPDRRKREPNSSNARQLPLRDNRRSPVPLIIAGLLVLGGLAYGLSRLLSRPQRSEPAITTAPTAPAATVPASPTAPAASPSSTPIASPSPVSPVASARAAISSPSSSSATNSPIRVAMNITADAWVQVIADGRVTYEGTLTKGTQRNWSAQEELTIVSGNAGGVSLSYNQGAAKTMGSAGTVEEITFTPNSNAANRNSAARGNAALN